MRGDVKPCLAAGGLRVLFSNDFINVNNGESIDNERRIKCIKGKIRFTKIFISMVIILNLCVSNVYAYSNTEQTVYMDDKKRTRLFNVELFDLVF